VDQRPHLLYGKAVSNRRRPFGRVSLALVGETPPCGIFLC
jgi:hypothetical protein